MTYIAKVDSLFLTKTEHIAQIREYPLPQEAKHCKEIIETC